MLLMLNKGNYFYYEVLAEHCATHIRAHHGHMKLGVLLCIWS